MTRFDEELKKGVFQICYCQKCSHVIWPPNDKCPICHNDSNWKESNNVGKIVEFSKNDSSYFGIVELEEKIRILGKILSKNEPVIGQDVKMSAKYDNGPQYTFSVENN